MNIKTEKFKYFGGFDYLRVFFMTAIVAWHTKLFGMSNLFQGDPSKFSVGLRDVLYCNICLVGVPLFFLISIFLYIRGRKTKKGYFQKRIKYLTILFVFWIIVDSMVNLGQIINWNMLSFRYYLNGGTNSTLWFLFCLILLTLAAELGICLQNIMKRETFLRLQYILFFITSFLWLFKIPIFNLVCAGYKDIWITFRNPIDYLPYVCLAFILICYYDNGLLTKQNPNLKKLLMLFCITIVPIAFFEWRLLPNEIFAKYFSILIPPYTRLSLMITTLAIFLFFIMREYYPPKVIKSLSELTLGIYIIHWFIWINFTKLFSIILPYIPIDQIPILRFLAVLIIASALAYCLKKSRCLVKLKFIYNY